VGGLDAPGLRVEVVGAVADILHRSEGDTFVGHGDDSTWGVGRQHKCFATEIFQGIGVGEGDVGMFAFRKIGGEDF